MKITWRRRKMKCEARSAMVSTVPFLYLAEERGDLTQRTQRKRAEITEIRKEERNGLPLACKSPPFPPAADEGWGGLKFRWAAA